MPLPALNSEGALPPGIHLALLNEVIALFGSGTTARQEVTQRLEEVHRLAVLTGHLKRLFVWGSYVTDKLSPHDVDVMLVMSAGFAVESSMPETHIIFDGERAEKELGATVLWVREDLPSFLLDAFLDQWQIGRDGRRRGIVEVIL
jgi:hypothetical protein